MNKLNHPDFLTKRQVLSRLSGDGPPVMSLRTLERHLTSGNIKRSGKPGNKVLVAWKDYLAFKNNLERGLI